ncbi:MAG: DUF3604 domain-containing protein [Deltaproteobacteria bacterium]|nr:DUF3604 domain-containing protein [Deltaproteobacteria bacterium]MBW2665112.1 DUF3604 domain-containing protein [Deltaproteobacteria bacterium]
MRKLLLILAVLACLAAGVGFALGHGWLGQRQGAGEVTEQPVPEAWTQAKLASERAAAAALDAPVDRQILFGDLHVHSSFSFDAFMLSLPMFQGEGAHPTADACDYARFCSGLDFWSINDHAEGLTPFQWDETKRSVRQCQAVAGDPASPDLVSFLGWEWTQIGTTPDNHYGHKNVILQHLEEENVPARPISSRYQLFPPGSATQGIGPALRLLMIAGSPGSESRQPYLDAARFHQDRDETRPCPTGVPVRDLPLDCQEGAPTPGELFDKLDEWGFPYMVIPHGNTWGFYTPPGTSWDKQLAAHDDPARREPLFEIFSGHGNSEKYRDFRAVEFDSDGTAYCPEPRADYLPSCWRAGEIIRQRCVDAGESDDECERRAVIARRHYLEAGTNGAVTVPAATIDDWLDAGQCRDCYMPSFNYRPANSGQYALALTNFDDPEQPKRFRFGFIASSDVHTARPGTGYKEIGRRLNTDSALGQFASFIPRNEKPEPNSVAIDSGVIPLPEFERFSSFFGTGGLVAVHSSGRDRDSIWDALGRKEVYGTSGDRILLWFDLLRDSAADLPMGSQTTASATPHFRVRAAGAFHQNPGCPEHSVASLSADRLNHLCRGECYNPSDTRKRITRIEVVRIRPQATPREPVADLVEDPWLVLPCSGESDGCTVEFSDPEFGPSARDALYYVRAIQEPTPTINADALRCEDDPAGVCRAVDPCYGGPKTDYDEDCTSDAEERAWSSPIYIDHVPDRGA